MVGRGRIFNRDKIDRMESKKSEGSVKQTRELKTAGAAEVAFLASWRGRCPKVRLFFCRGGGYALPRKG